MAAQKGAHWIETKGQRHLIKVLLDSGSNICLLNQERARRPEIPNEAQNSLLEIPTFDGEIVTTGSTFSTYPILIAIGTNDHLSRISCEIANEGKYDLIIPFGWWHNEHRLKIDDPGKWVFEEKECYAHTENEGVADLFERDEPVAYDQDTQYVRRIGWEEARWVQLEGLPKP